MNFLYEMSKQLAGGALIIITILWLAHAGGKFLAALFSPGAPHRWHRCCHHGGLMLAAGFLLAILLAF